jgi:hypothetical protein
MHAHHTSIALMLSISQLGPNDKKKKDQIKIIRLLKNTRQKASHLIPENDPDPR